MATMRLGATSIDCADPATLAAFWSELLGGEVQFSSDEFVAVQLDGGWLTTVRVDPYHPPTWPDGDRPKQLHLDVAVSDLDEAEARAMALGATKPAEQPQPDRWRVLLDPAGHPFCLSNQIPD